VPRAARPPWIWLPILGLIALGATALLALNARSRIRTDDEAFSASQLVRLKSVEVRIDDYFGRAIQLAAAAAQTLAPVNERASAERLVGELFLARRTSNIYGLGVFYVPGAFAPGRHLYAIYDEAGRRGVVQMLQRPSDLDYTRELWWQRATAAPGRIVYAGPYAEDGKSFISTLQAFSRNGRPTGVVTVDVLTGDFKRLMSAPLEAGDVAWIESSRRGRQLVVTAPLTDPAARIDRSVPMRYTGAYVHLSTDARGLRARQRAVVTATVLAAIGVWVLAAIVAGVLFAFWRSRESEIALEAERRRLETEIAIGKRVETELRKAAYTDALTGLPNREAFLETVRGLLNGGKAGDAVLLIDLDRFNILNETLGHPAGDELIKVVGARLSQLPVSSVARLGGDEFLVIASAESDGAAGLAQRILSAVREPVLLGGRTTFATASIGIVLLDAGYAAAEDVLRDADIAMYEAKRRGRAGYATFDRPMRDRVAVESQLDHDLRRAIDEGALVAYYQPIVDTQRGHLVSFEALARWRKPDGTVEAHEFIPFAERRELINRIDALMLECVCRDAAAIFARFPEATLAVNLSAAHITAPDLASTVGTVLKHYGVAPERLRLEITETAIMSNAERARYTLDRLKRMGLQIVLDDFGSGHSSLAYLHRLPIAGVKIDRSFVAPLPGDEQAAAIVASIVALAKTLSLYTVAEGVETQDQLEALRRLGVVNAQGYLFSRARELEDVLAWKSMPA